MAYRLPPYEAFERVAGPCEHGRAMTANATRAMPCNQTAGARQR